MNHTNGSPNPLERLILQTVGTRVTYLLETPARRWAENLAAALRDLTAWVEDYHDMKDDPSAPAVLLEARNLLERIDQPRPTPTPRQTELEHIHAARMHTLIRRIVTAHGFLGDVPASLQEEALELLATLERPGHQPAEALTPARK